MPALEVHAVSETAERMEPFSTPSLSFFSVRAFVSASGAGAGAVQAGSDLKVPEIEIA